MRTVSTENRPRPLAAAAALAWALLAILLAPVAASADETFVVDTLADGIDDNPGDRICRTGPAGPCTLRAAAMEASDASYSAAETLTIELGPGEHRLTQFGSVNFVANAPVEVQGAGYDRTTIRQTQPTRVLLHTGASYLFMDDVTITGGDVDGSDDGSLNGNGGGIYMVGDARFENVLIYDNHTTGSSPTVGGTGGGMYSGRELNLITSAVIGNSARSGGGMEISGASSNVVQSTVVADNTAEWDGGITANAEVLISDSVIRGNTATDTIDGVGGIALSRFDQQWLERVEISGNEGFGGGVVTGGNASLRNVTISGNRAHGGRGGGIDLSHPYDAGIELDHVTVTGNTGTAATAINSQSIPEVTADGPPLVRHSILDGTCDNEVLGGDQNIASGTSCLPNPVSGGDLEATDPQLGPLADNGGLSRTHMPAATSPAVGLAGGDIIVLDQRRASRAGSPDDSGAVERDGAFDLPPLALPPALDETPPETTITAGPAEGSSDEDGAVSFGFTASEAGSSFECRLDSAAPAAFAPCVSPRQYGGLGLGPHRFEVRAIDGSGNIDLSPAVRNFTVAAPSSGPFMLAGPSVGPDTELVGHRVMLAKRIFVRGRELVVKVRVGAGEPVKVVSRASLIERRKGRGRGGSVIRKTRRTKLRTVRDAVADGRVKVLRHKLRGSGKKRQRKTRKLKRGITGGDVAARLQVKVTLTDQAGNSVTETRVARVKVRRGKRR